jgi:hypothetical protein
MTVRGRTTEAVMSTNKIAPKSFSLTLRFRSNNLESQKQRLRIGSCSGGAKKLGLVRGKVGGRREARQEREGQEPTGYKDQSLVYIPIVKVC